MKLLTVTFKEYDGKVLTSLCEYDTKTKQKNYISIPLHIALLISDKTSEHRVNDTLCSCHLKQKEVSYYQD